MSISYFMRKIIALSFIMIGTVLGAGFASGQEIFQYFARFGKLSIPLAIVSAVLFFFSYKFLLDLSNRERFLDYDAFSRRVFRKVSPIFDVFLCFSFIVLCGSMYASVNQLQEMLFNVDFPVLSFITAILCVLISLKGFSGLAKASVLTIPPIIFAILVLSFSKIDVGQMFFQPVTFALGVDGLLSAILYVAMNVLLSGVFLVLIGKNYTKKQIKIASITSISLLGVLLISICLCLIANPRVVEGQVPLLVLSFSISKIFGYMFCVVIWCAVFSTLVSSSFTCINIISSKNQFLSSFIVVLAGYLISSIGFSNIVKWVYPIIGCVGIVFMFATVLAFRRRKINSKKLTNKI